MILVCGFFLWLIVGIAIWQLVALSSRNLPPSRLQIALLIAVFTAGSILLFRPHMEMFGGEDAGAYLNASMTYARKGTLFPVDPLLSQVPMQTRPIFFYNVGLYGQTKDGVLWIKDLNEATLRPHFQPAYPLMMSLVAKFAPTHLILYVAPLFTLLAALVFWALGTLLFRDNWAGLATAAFFLVSPVTAWHGRCARAEAPSVFFLFAGLFFLLYAWKNKNENQAATILLGSVCVFASTFFHILTWFAIIPLTIWAFFVLLNGKRNFLLYFLCFICSVALFILQTTFVTDAYFLGESIEKAVDSLSLTQLTAALLFAAALCILLNNYKKIRLFLASNKLASTRCLSMVVLIISLCGLFFVIFLGDKYPIKGVLHPYLLWTDFEGLRFLLSRPVLFLGLLGGVFLLLREGRGGREERTLFWMLLLPGILLMGWVENYMLDNRRFLLFLVPLLSLSFTALIMFIWERIPGKAYTAWIGILLILVLTIQNRTHLYTLQEYEGLLDFFSPYAHTVKQDNGILLFEYTRFGAIFDHFFGIPTLSLNNKIHQDYSAAEVAWKDIMLANPDRPAYFATPFQTPQSEHFIFTPVHDDAYQGSVLKQERNRLPTQINTSSFGLTLYRMSVSTLPSSQKAMHPFPSQARLNAGNMGLTRFANLRKGPWSIKGIPLIAGEPFVLPLKKILSAPPRELLLFLQTSKDDSEALPAVEVTGGNERLAVQWDSLGPHWWLARILLPNFNHHPPAITLQSASELALCGIKTISEQDMQTHDLEMLPGATQLDMHPLLARWARNDASILLPLSDGGTDVFMLMKESEDRGIRELILKHGTQVLGSLMLEPNTWGWHMLRLPPGFLDKGLFRLTLHVPNPWNPGLSHFPSDLAVLMSTVSVAPR